MKLFLCGAFASVVLFYSPAFAADDHHPAAGAPAAEMAQPKMNDSAMTPMQEKMTKMQAQMALIRKTTDPVERKKLMDEHMMSMQKCMDEMHTGMMKQMPKDGMAKSAAADEMSMSPAMMKDHMDMMQKMMEQMMEHQKAMQGMAK